MPVPDLRHQIESYEAKCQRLETDIDNLKRSLARKYAHCNRLKEKIAHLSQELALTSQTALIPDAVDKMGNLLRACWISDNFSSSECEDYLVDSCDGIVPLYEEQKYKSQSGSEAGQTTDMADTVEQQIASYDDGAAGFKTVVEGSYEATMNPGFNNAADIGGFLGRPSKIFDYDWIVGQQAYLRFNPWQLFFEDLKVADKIRNFNLLRCKLHLKFVINGVAFHYGRLMVSYNPIPSQDNLTVNRLGITEDLVGASQKPHVFLNPTTSEGAEMVLPFFWFRNYMQIPDADYRRMGECFLNSFQVLRQANGGTDPVRVTCFAWAEDVVLTMPTSLDQPSPAPPVLSPGTDLLMSQSGMADGTQRRQSKATRIDEYGMGIISKPASAVAKASGMLESIPMLYPYAKATSMVSSAIAGAARLFGYSRPPIVTDIQLYKPFPQGNLANVDASEAVSKLTLDSKQEITIDPRTVGLGPEDQMSVKSIVTRESYLTQFNWSELDQPGGLLWNSYVTPDLLANLNGELHMTPMCHYAKMWEYWHGTIKFRFQIVASSFHKGRILVRYDPAFTATPIEFNTGFSRIVDIAQEPDFEIEVSWGNAIPFVRVDDTSVERYSGGARLARDTARTNGMIELSVINTLTAPTDDKPISVNVFVSMGDDFKFGSPSSYFNNYSVFPEQPAALLEEEKLDSQSGEDASCAMLNEKPTENKPTSPAAIMQVSTPSNPTDETMSVFFGESVTSIRELMKRYVYYRFYSRDSTATPGQLSIWSIASSGLPACPGFDPTGSDLVGGSNATVVTNTAVAYFRVCYAAWRGSLRKKFVFQGSPTNSNIFVYRDPVASQVISSTDDVATTNFNRVALSRGGDVTAQGTAMTPLGQNSVLEVEIPFMENIRFFGPRFARRTTTFSTPVTVREQNVIESLPAPATISSQSRTAQEWVAAGEDFTLFFYTGVPILYRYNLTNI